MIIVKYHLPSLFVSVGDNILPESWNFDPRFPYPNIEERSLDDNVLGE